MHKLKIREYRQLKSLTQKELSKRTNLSQGYLSALENNKKSPTFRNLCKVAKALEVCPCMLIKHSKKYCKEKD